MTERDPRTDPQPGDEINMRGRRVRVLAIFDGDVLYELLETGKNLTCDALASADMWQRIVKSATVLKRGPHG